MPHVKRGGIVDITTRLRDERSGFQMPVGPWDFLQNVNIKSGTNLASYLMGTVILSRG